MNHGDEATWDAIPSIDCVDEHLQDSFDFYSVRVPGVGRRVQREDLSKLVWSVTRAAVSQARCDAIAQTISDDLYLTISQCERVIRDIEMQECDKFLKSAEIFLKKHKDPPPLPRTEHRTSLCLPDVCCVPENQLIREVDPKDISKAPA